MSIFCRFAKTGFTRQSGVLFLTGSLLLAAMLSGCSTGKNTVHRQGQDVFVAIDVPEEMMPENYVPSDDGRPLSSAELAALHSTGQLDKTLTNEEKRLVELHFKSYVHNPKSLERQIKRSELYLPYVKQVFRSKGLPEELAYLAFVESAYNPNAVSHAGACGMWQFMPYTGKMYGLSRDHWLDERRDPYKATVAAADYLQKLYNDFKDWHLAIASYNAGEGKIGRALSGTGAKSFFEICRKNDMLDYKAQLREETQQYVPRFLAITKVMRNLRSLGIAQPNPSKALSVATVSVPAGVDLMRFASEIDVDWSQFAGLNPAFRRTISHPDKRSTAYVPAARGQRATAWLSRKSAGEYAGWREYKVRRTDSLGLIAQRNGTSAALLRRANNKTSNALRVGEMLLVPGSSRIADMTLAKLDPNTRSTIVSTAEREHKESVAAAKTRVAYHRVGKGETLSALSRKWGVSVASICSTNKIKTNTRLSPGQRLRIPANSAVLARNDRVVTPKAKPAPSLVAEARNASNGKGKSMRYVTVQQGDTLYGIARANGLSVAELCKANNMTARTKLRVGQQLRLMPATPGVPTVADASKKKAVSGVKTAAAKSRAVVVQSGDTLYSLARANNTSVAALIKLNGLSPKGTLRLGQVLQLP